MKLEMLNYPAAANSAIVLVGQIGDQGRGVAGQDC